MSWARLKFEMNVHSNQFSPSSTAGLSGEGGGDTKKNESRQRRDLIDVNRVELPGTYSTHAKQFV